MAGTGVIALSLGLGLVAGTISAPTVASAAAAKASPKVYQTVSSRSVSYGQDFKLTAKVLNGKTGKAATGRVSFQRYYSTGWKTLVTRSLDKGGKITFLARPLTSGSYRANYLGSTAVNKVAFSSVKVTVKTGGAKVLTEAAKHKGALYKYGAAGPSRFDCSGFTMWVYKKAAGRKLPHKANSQQRYGKAVSKSAKKPGDLIIFRSGSYGYHAAVYAGGNQMWDSPHSGARVSKRKMISSNYVVRRLA